MFSKFKTIATALFLTAFLFVGCKKAAQEIDFAVESATHSDDQTIVSNELDGLANDFNNVVDNYSNLSGRIDRTNAIPCDATVAVDTSNGQRKITITYNGSTCLSHHTRTGVVVLSLSAGVRWKDVGAVLTVSIQNLKITRTADNKSITINGTKTIKNITGGLIRNLASAGTITHEISSNGMSITFDDNTQRTWQVAKKRVFTYNNGIVITTTGNATVDGVSGISEWGTNRYGNNFATLITQPMIIRQDCNFRLTNGEIKHTKLQATITVTFGLDANGNATTCPQNGTYYFKAVYVSSTGVTRSIIKPYN